MRSMVLLTLALALAIPASASGADAQVSTFTDPFSGLPISQVRYSAAAGERNAVTVSAAADVWEIRDTGATILAGPGCVPVDAHAVRCANPTPGTYALSVATRDGDDRVSVAPGVRRMIVTGGSGDDVLSGGDSVAISGGAGNDVIEFSRTPPNLSCGRGSDVLGLLRGRLHLLLDRVDVAACEHARIGTLVIAVKPRRSGRALVMSARCTADGPCRGAISLLLLHGRSSTAVGMDGCTLGKGERTTLRVAVNASERRLLAVKGTIVDVNVRARNARVDGGREQIVGWRVPAAP